MGGRMIALRVGRDEASDQCSQWGCPICMRLAQEWLLARRRIGNQRPAVSVARHHEGPNVS